MRLNNYWWLILWPLMFGAFGYFANMQRVEVVDGQRVVRWKPFVAFVFSVPFIIWAGWRQGFGDTEQYRITFSKLPSSFSQIWQYMKGIKKGYGFRLFQVLFKCIISKSDIAFFLVIAAIQILCLVYIYRKYSSNFWLSFFLFVASTDYLSWVHNGMRQFIAAVIILLCIPLIAKKRYVAVLIIVLLTSQIHVTALIFLPFIFVVNGKTWNFRTLAFMAAIILAVIFADRITGFISNALVDTAYEGDIDILIKDNGTNIMRVLFYSVPAIMSLAFRSYMDKANDPIISICGNLSIITAGFYIFSYFTSGILMGAIPIYFSLTNYILIPWILKEIFSRDSAKVLNVIFVSVYTVFFYYQCGPTWGLL